MKNFETYCRGLSQTMNIQEKAFFLKELDLNQFQVIIDFGCGTGELLHIIDEHAKSNKDLVLIGVDNNDEMRAKVISNWTFEHGFFTFKSLSVAQEIINWVKEARHEEGLKILMIFSSVLHECNKKMLLELERFCRSYAEAIVIRDTVLFEQIDNDKIPVKEFAMYQKLREADIKFLEVFRNQKGNIHNALYEYFLKYTYTENWWNEIRENYFNPDAKDFILRLTLPKNNVFFRMTFQDHYVLPYKKQQVQSDFGYTMECPTHSKLILRRYENTPVSIRKEGICV